MKLQDLFEKQKVIKGNVVVPDNVTKLDYEGVIVKGAFNCSHTKITSLMGAPKYVGGYFDCSHTKITSLEGAPTYIGERFGCSFTDIISLHNIHEQIKHIGRVLFCSGKVKSHVLGVMFIKGLDVVVFGGHGREQFQVAAIINKHLAGDRNPHECQEELIDAGFPEYARL